MQEALFLKQELFKAERARRIPYGQNDPITAARDMVVP